MNEPHEELLAIADTMDTLVQRGFRPEIQEPLSQLEHVANEVAKAWSGSWLGYHANVYYEDLKPRPAGAHFSQQSGLKEPYFSDTPGEWEEFDPAAVEATIHERAGNSDLTASDALREEAVREFKLHKLNALSIIETVDSSDNFVKRLGGDLDKLRILDRSDLVNAWRPKGQFVSSDMLALGQGLWSPPHISVLAQVIAARQALDAVEKLANLARQAGSHLLRIPLSANLTETPAPLGITVGRWR